MPNQAAWVDAAGKPFRVGDAPDWPMDKSEVRIRNYAVAFNPADHFLADTGMYVGDRWPFIFGVDVAGEVIECGPDVTRVKKGDRVLASTGGAFGKAGAKCGAFQLESVVTEIALAKIPDSCSYVDACVLPLATATAASALYPKFHLGLDYPTVPGTPSNSKILLIWGASSSVGAVAVQMAVQAGYEVLATCSSKNFDFVKGLGAVQVFDYKSPTVIDDIVKAVKGRDANYVGSFTAMQARDEPLHAAFVAGKLDIKTSIAASSDPRVKQEGLPENVRIAPVFATQIFTDDIPMPGVQSDLDVGKRIFGSWLSKALEHKSIKAVPTPVVVGNGLEAVQEAIDRLRKGVSAQKLVVEL